MTFAPRIYYLSYTFIFILHELLVLNTSSSMKPKIGSHKTLSSPPQVFFIVVGRFTKIQFWQMLTKQKTNYHISKLVTPTESRNTVDFKSDEKILIIETQKGVSAENYFSDIQKWLLVICWDSELGLMMVSYILWKTTLNLLILCNTLIYCINLHSVWKESMFDRYYIIYYLFNVF